MIGLVKLIGRHSAMKLAKKRTSHHTPCCKAASSLKQSLRKQYGLSVPIIFRYWHVVPLGPRQLKGFLYYAHLHAVIYAIVPLLS
jgi:hypothetical protein